MLSNHEFKVLIVELNIQKKYITLMITIYNTVISFGFKPYNYEPKNRVLKELQTYNKHQFDTIFVRDIEFVNARFIASSTVKINNQYF